MATSPDTAGRIAPLIAIRLVMAFGFGFFLSMFTRAVAAMLEAPLRTELQLSDGVLGLAMGSFFVAFGLAQLPIGLLLDRFDPRKVNASLIVLAAAGAIVFSQAHSALMLGLGRIMLGFGFAAGMMSAFRAYAHWFPAERLPVVNSIQFSIGVLGALSATRPIGLALEVMSWRDIYLGFAGLALLAAIVMVTVAPRHTDKTTPESLDQLLRGLGSVLKSPFFWRIAPWPLLAIGCSAAMTLLWVAPWLRDVAGMSQQDVQDVYTLMQAVAVPNYLLMGFLAQSLARRGFDGMAVPVGGLILSSAMLTLLVIGVANWPVTIWILFIVANAAITLVMPYLASSYPPALAGRVYTSFNFIQFTLTFVVQAGVGIILDLFPKLADGSNAPTSYQWAFGVFLALQLTAGAWYVISSRLGFGRRENVGRKNHV